MQSAMIWASPVASTTRSKPPTSSPSAGSGVSRCRDIARAGDCDEGGAAVGARIAGGGPDLETGQPEEVRREHSDGSCPSTSALCSSHGCRPPIARAWRMPRAQVDAGSASTPRRPSERGIAISCVGSSATISQCESVQARDPPLAVVASETGVGRPLVARAAVGARAADQVTRSPRANPCPSRSTRPSNS